ncbi:MAG TPA: hypothetical protein VNY36_04610 [Bacteroidia bacterium]|nr:hypothetical protein [Bacteroidia bacterium]
MNIYLKRKARIIIFFCLLGSFPLIAQDTTKGSYSSDEVDSTVLDYYISHFEETDSVRWNIPELNKAINSGYMMEREKLMVEEINMVRAFPKRYAVFIDEYIEKLKKKSAFKHTSSQNYTITKSHVTINGNEVIKNDTVWNTDPDKDELNAAIELSNILKTMNPVSILKPIECVYIAAKKHGIEAKNKGDLDHQGTNGSWPWDRIGKECTKLEDGNENLAGGFP